MDQKKIFKLLKIPYQKKQYDSPSESEENSENSEISSSEEIIEEPQIEDEEEETSSSEEEVEYHNLKKSKNLKFKIK